MDDRAGLTCRRTGRRLDVFDDKGRRVRDRATIERVRALAIPPAWTRVWIARDPKAHLQATGRDAAGRKQYRYHPRWRMVRDAAKYHHLAAFGRVLPLIRRRVASDLRQPPLSRLAVLATVVRLLERTSARIGNEEYAKQNGSHGLTTLRDRHVTVRGSHLRFSFRAKSGVRQTIEVTDASLAAAVRRCQELPGQVLFQYRDADRRVRAVTSTDVNAYLREIAGQDITAKDFRTWTATLLAAKTLGAMEPCADDRSRRQSIVHAIDQVARELGNTRAVCRSCYIHPAVIDAYTAGVRIGDVTPRRCAGLRQAERALLTMVEPAATRRRRA